MTNYDRAMRWLTARDRRPQFDLWLLLVMRCADPIDLTVDHFYSGGKVPTVLELWAFRAGTDEVVGLFYVETGGYYAAHVGAVADAWKQELY